MARLPLKLEEMIDGAALKRKLAALSRKGGVEHAARRAAALDLFKGALASGHGTAERMLRDDGGGTACAKRLSYLMDQIIQALHDFAANEIASGEPASKQAARMAVVATGGYGRGPLRSWRPGSSVPTRRSMTR